MNLVNLTINNKSVSVPKGSTIIEAARKLNVHLVVYVWLVLVKD